MGGVTVGTATLHNQDQVAAKDVRPGDTVIVRRAGDVIPEVVGPVLSERDPASSPWSFPTDCPVCGHTLVRDEEAAATHCVNFSCARQIRGRIEHFVGRYAMDIEYLGEKNIDRFVSLGLLNDVADLYALDYDRVLELDRIGAKSVENLQAAIEGSKARPLGNLLFGLRIPEIGQVNGQTLAAAFGSMDAVMAATVEEIAAVDGFGQVIAEAVHAWFANEQAQDLLARLKAAGLTMEAAEVDRSKEQTLEGQAVVVSGTLNGFTRDGAKEAILERGGKSPGSVSKKTLALVVGADPGASKVTKAKRRACRSSMKPVSSPSSRQGSCRRDPSCLLGCRRSVHREPSRRDQRGRRRAWAHPCAAVGGRSSAISPASAGILGMSWRWGA